MVIIHHYSNPSLSTRHHMVSNIDHHRRYLLTLSQPHVFVPVFDLIDPHSITHDTDIPKILLSLHVPSVVTHSMIYITTSFNARIAPSLLPEEQHSLNYSSLSKPYNHMILLVHDNMVLSSLQADIIP